MTLSWRCLVNGRHRHLCRRVLPLEQLHLLLNWGQPHHQGPTLRPNDPVVDLGAARDCRTTQSPKRRACLSWGARARRVALRSKLEGRHGACEAAMSSKSQCPASHKPPAAAMPQQSPAAAEDVVLRCHCSPLPMGPEAARHLCRPPLQEPQGRATWCHIVTQAANPSRRPLAVDVPRVLGNILWRSHTRSRKR